MVFLSGFAALTMSVHAEAVTVFSQPVGQSGGFYQSSKWAPDGGDYDQYVWDDFTLRSTTTISAIDWAGTYDPAKSGSGGKVPDFVVAVYPSIPAGSQPDIARTALVEYHTDGNANETAADAIAGVQYYGYSFVLPTPFIAAAETKYWVQIEALQQGIPDWGIAAATVGDGAYFRRIANAGDIYYQAAQGDAAFILVGQSVTVQAGEASVNRHRYASPTSTNAALTFVRGDGFVYSDATIISVFDFLGRKRARTKTDGYLHSSDIHRLPDGMFIARFSKTPEGK